MSFWRARFVGSTVAIVAALAWFVATNHCLLGVTRDAQSNTVSTCHCPDHSRGTDGQDKGQMLACCQGLLSSVLELASAKVKFTPVLLGLQLIAVDPLFHFEVLQHESAATEYDTGPPRQSCFVRTVLKRSLPENAPPFFV